MPRFPSTAERSEIKPNTAKAAQMWLDSKFPPKTAQIGWIHRFFGDIFRLHLFFCWLAAGCPSDLLYRFRLFTNPSVALPGESQTNDAFAAGVWPVRFHPGKRPVLKEGRESENRK